jgi:hypothetical protein
LGVQVLQECSAIDVLQTDGVIAGVQTTAGPMTVPIVVDAMKSPYITLQPSEQTLVTAAAAIYSAYIATGRVEDGQENAWIDRAIKAAIRIAKVTDETVQADRELD